MPILTEKQTYWRIRELNPKETQRTIVVLGLARGGTSMIAGILRLLGVNMGTTLNSSHENRQFRTALLGKESVLDYLLIPFRLFGGYRRLLKRYNQSQDMWGIKDPTLNPYLPWLAPRWRNPVYILVLRNPLATAESQQRHFQQGFNKLLNKVLTGYVRLYDFAIGTKRPLLVINYEAALQNKKEVIQVLADYCGITPETKDYLAAIEFIDQKKGYQWIIDRNIQLVGFVENMSAQHVYGWAFNPQTQQPVNLALLENDKEIARTVANQPRKDVAENPELSRLLCGFKFDLAQLNKKTNFENLHVVDLENGLKLPLIKSNQKKM